MRRSHELPDSFDQLFTTKMVLTALSMSSTDLNRKYAAGEFPKEDRRIGHNRRWKRSTIEAYRDGLWEQTAA